MPLNPSPKTIHVFGSLNKEAVAFANAVAAASVMVPGAQASLPVRSCVAALQIGLKHL